MVNTVHEEMQQDESWRVWKEVVDVEQESVHHILQDRPDHVPCKETREGLRDGIAGNEANVGNGQRRIVEEAGQRRRELKHRPQEKVQGDGPPDHGDDPPLCSRAYF